MFTEVRLHTSAAKARVIRRAQLSRKISSGLTVIFPETRGINGNVAEDRVSTLCTVPAQSGHGRDFAPLGEPDFLRHGNCRKVASPSRN